MPIAAGDVRTYKSLNADSDGGAIDTSREVVSGVDNNLYPDITSTEAQVGGTRYRKVFRKNTHGSLTWTGVRTYIKTQPTNATISAGIGLDHADDVDGAQGNLQKWTAAAKVALISDGADTRNVTIIGEVGGVLTTEVVALTGAVEVLSVATFDTGPRGVYACYVASLDASRTVTIKQGSGGPTRGTIGPNKKISFLWLTGTDLDTESEGYKHGNIAALANFGLWFRLVWPANTVTGTGFSMTITSAGD